MFYLKKTISRREIMICECMFAKWKKSMLFFLIKVFVYKMRYIYSLKLCSLSYLNMFKNAENYLVASWEVFLLLFFYVDTAQLRPLAWNNEKVCFPRQKEPNRTHHLHFGSSEPLIFLYVSMLSSYFLTVVLSTLSRRRLYWSVYDPRATLHWTFWFKDLQ